MGHRSGYGLSSTSLRRSSGGYTAGLAAIASRPDILWGRSCCSPSRGAEQARSTPLPWTLNLRAHPVVPVQVGREIGTYRAREATKEEVRRYWPRLVEIWPAYQTHYDKSGQRSLFVLEPVPTAGEQLRS